MTEPSAPEISFEDFRILFRQTGLPDDGIQLERLFEGYIKLRLMVSVLNRPAEMKTGLAVTFRAEAAPCCR